MTSRIILKMIAIGVMSTSIAMQAQAHRAWILPSSTILSGDEPFVTFDAAASNTIFFADHAALNLKNVTAVDPKGHSVELLNSAKGKYRSTFDIQLGQEGTYKIGTSNGGLRARWEDEEGKRKRWPRRGKSATDADFAKEVPKNAKKLQVSRSSVSYTHLTLPTTPYV